MSTIQSNADHPDHSQTWETYVAAWKAEGAEHKRKLFETCLHPDSVYHDPLTSPLNREQLLQYMLDFHHQVPGAHFVTRQFRCHHNKSVALWKMMDGEGNQLGEGVSYGEYAGDGRLIAETGFFDVPDFSNPGPRHP